MPVPRVVHFVHGLATLASDVHFGFEHYLAVVSAATHIRPDAIVFHHHHVPTGEWWARALPLLTLRQVELPTEIFGNPLSHAAHRADVVRLRALLSEGGIYLDMDVLALRPFDALLGSTVTVLGKEGRNGEHGLCNAVIASPPGSPFLARWLESYKTFDGTHWAEHSVLLPMKLARAHPEEVLQLGAEAFFWPMWDDAALRRLLLYREYDFAPNYASHLWSQAAHAHVLSVWSETFIRSLASSLNCRIRQALPAVAQRSAGTRDAASLRAPNDSVCGCETDEIERSLAAASEATDASAGPAGLGQPRSTPRHHWPLDAASAFAHAGTPALEERTHACFARDVGGGCAHAFFFNAGCEPEPVAEAKAEGVAGANAARFSPFVRAFEPPNRGSAQGKSASEDSQRATDRVTGQLDSQRATDRVTGQLDSQRGSTDGLAGQLDSSQAAPGEASALGWTSGLEGFAALQGDWLDFSLSWQLSATPAAAASHVEAGAQAEAEVGAQAQLASRPDEAEARALGASAMDVQRRANSTSALLGTRRILGEQNASSSSSGGFALDGESGLVAVWWSIVFAGGGQLSASLERPLAGGPGLEVVVRTRDLRSAPLPCQGLRSGLRLGPSDLGWHSASVHFTKQGLLQLEIDGRAAASVRWARPSGSRVVGLWLGTAQVAIAARPLPVHQLHALAGFVRMRDVRVFVPALSADERERARAARPDGWPAGFAPQPLLEPAPEGWATVGARMAQTLQCDALAQVGAKPVSSAVLIVCLVGVCALLGGRRIAQRCAQARYRRRLTGVSSQPSDKVN